ncbi:DgyrCDS11860 [Dimorphilus gyrociliatus]|uniref:Tetratricopeptide repeat protein 30 n=1 Tax=Dimorphilus gyrociliatus TaxID=2664684 RepID=A0A7I8W8C6_9ANNE|nr:DgyrCDS11860 [Dimorphilus gyrociliatus]
MSLGGIKEGEVTSTIYGMIKDQRYFECVQTLNNITQTYSKVEEYKMYYAQSLYKACLYDEAMRVSCQIDNPDYQGRVLKLQSAIKYEEDDIPSAQSLVEQAPSDDPDTEVNLACLLYKEGRYEEACKKFQDGLNAAGYRPDLSYNIALCNYEMKRFAPALKHIADIIERGIRDHPELSVGMTTEGIDVRSVGNTLTLHETQLVEAFNLKAAIEYLLKNYDAAREALTDMPPRSEEEIDVVTLHNHALMNMDTKPSEGFEKLQFLLQQNPFPKETFGNLLLLYVKYEYYDMAADVLAENIHLSEKYLTPYLYDFLEAVITRQTSPEEAYKKLDDMASKQTEQLRKLTKDVQEARQSHDDEAVKRKVNEYDECLDRYIPVLMQQAKIYWDLENYTQVEKIFRKSVEFCNEHDTWKLNVAHVLFMQDGKFKEAAGFYEPIVKKHFDNILDVSAIVLANLCVSYIMTSQNEEAEELMRKIEKEEEQAAYDDPDKKQFHLSIVNLVIGTLYCAKGNYEFGISRVIKSLEPFQKKLGTDTWFYAKRCFLSLIENLSKHMVMLRDQVLLECVQFLEQCELYGKDVKAVIEQPLEQDPIPPGKNTVTYEARHLKALLMQLMY